MISGKKVINYSSSSGVRLPDEGDGEDVRVQEAGEEARQEAEGREHGPLGETHPPEDQLKVSVYMHSWGLSLSLHKYPFL